MKKRTIKIMQNHAITLTIAVMVFMMASLTGCSKEPATNEATKPSTESTTETKADKTEQSTEGAEVSSEAAPEPTVEATADATPEPTPEPIVYEGIDMESDLPGEEWIKTFIGVVDEPVAIIYNDDTGRKEIIQEGCVVNVNPDEDKFAVYVLERSVDCYLNIPVAKTNIFGNYNTIVPLAEGVRSAPEWDTKLTVEGRTEDWEVNFTIIVE